MRSFPVSLHKCIVPGDRDVDRQQRLEQPRAAFLAFRDDEMINENWQQSMLVDGVFFYLSLHQMEMEGSQFLVIISSCVDCQRHVRFHNRKKFSMKMGREQDRWSRGETLDSERCQQRQAQLRICPRNLHTINSLLIATVQKYPHSLLTIRNHSRSPKNSHTPMARNPAGPLGPDSPCQWTSRASWTSSMKLKLKITMVLCRG